MSLWRQSPLGRNRFRKSESPGKLTQDKWVAHVYTVDKVLKSVNVKHNNV